MSKSRWSLDDFKKAGLIQVDSSFVKASSQVEKGKVKKLPPLNIKQVHGFSAPEKPFTSGDKPFPPAVIDFLKGETPCPTCNGSKWIKHRWVASDQEKSAVPNYDPCPTCTKPVSEQMAEFIKEQFNAMRPQPFTQINIKPLSINAAFKGSRFKTHAYNAYCEAVSLLLPKEIIVPDGLLRVYYEFGLSSMGGDWDNPIKPLQDILSAKYKFNDNRIRSCGGVNLILVPKGQEYLKFRFESL